MDFIIQFIALVLKTSVHLSTSDENYYYLYNGHGDVVGLMDSKTGAFSGRYSYDSFGNIIEEIGTANNNITYAGYQYDKESGLYYLNARMYDSKTARFLQMDDYAGSQGDILSLNRYTYVHNNPEKYTDPTGHTAMPKNEEPITGKDVNHFFKGLVSAVNQIDTWQSNIINKYTPDNVIAKGMASSIQTNNTNYLGYQGAVLQFAGEFIGICADVTNYSNKLSSDPINTVKTSVETVKNAEDAIKKTLITAVVSTPIKAYIQYVDLSTNTSKQLDIAVAAITLAGPRSIVGISSDKIVSSYNAAYKADPFSTTKNVAYVAINIASAFIPVGAFSKAGLADDAIKSVDNVAGFADNIDEPIKIIDPVDDTMKLLDEGINEAIEGTSNLRYSGGNRQPVYRELIQEDIDFVKSEFEAIGGNPNKLRFNVGDGTSYSDKLDVINVKGDIFPLKEAYHPRSLMSTRATLAHEEYGHAAYRGTTVKAGKWNDEFRASYMAAKNTPNLSSLDRYYLIQDAIARAQEAGIPISYNDFMKSILYGY